MTTIDHPIAERRLFVDNDQERQLVVRIGQPAPDPAGDWLCPFHVEGIDSAPRDAHGIDAIQALEMAFEGARVTIERSGLCVSWFAGDGTGISRTVPSFLPPDQQRDIERYIDERINDFSVPPGAE